MRTREEIENHRLLPVEARENVSQVQNQILMLEVLLDIRDLLQNPPVENIGVPIDELTHTKEV